MCLCNSMVSAFVFSRIGILKLGNYSLPASSLNGTLQGLSFTICIGMVILDYNFGFIMASVCIGISFFGATRAIIMGKDMTSLPGTLNCILYILTLVFISRQLKLRKKIELTDKITNVLNRDGFEFVVRRKIHASDRGVIAFLHLRGMTDININLGRVRGDAVLHAVSLRIKKIIADSGDLFRLGGPEFALYLSSESKSIEIIEKVIASIEEKIEIESENDTVNVYISCKAGISDNISKYKELGEIIKNTDIALNHALKSDVLKYCVFNEEIKKSTDRNHEVEGFVKEAIDNNYFYLVYQPQFYIKNKRLRGFESLIRMKLPDGTFVSPGEFIAVAEKSDLILKIDSFVLRRAMEEFKTVLLEYGECYTLSVNISAKELAIPGFANRLLEIIEKVGFPKGCLEIEITEYSLAIDSENTVENIKKISENDIKIAIDDFGTGYTSLSQLLKLPVSLLKIDKSLVDNICVDGANRDFISAVIYMGHLMECEVISEGVEQNNQLSVLKELGCDFVQGYVWSKPIDFTSAVELCKEDVCKERAVR
ncbi:MAG: EAL domain-containing protein [Lachnospiraceae bacterium]|nr:EAL domain-containing protein [Lachnospiraceae bacterium]